MEDIQQYNMTHVVGSTDITNVIASPTYSFRWIVDDAIRSDTASSFGASTIHSFASIVDRGIRSSRASSTARTRTDFGTSLSSIYSFASSVYTRSVSPRLISLTELEATTNNFSIDCKIGAGRYGAVYKAILDDGQEVAIKNIKTKTWLRTDIELALLFHLHVQHKNLVRLAGFCEEKDERHLVYEYVGNGSLYDHLHHDSNLLNSWKMRIKIALDVSHGIEYLHNYAIPSIIHGNIKSSNILLDATWTAKVSDFESSFIIAEPKLDYRDTMVRSFRYVGPAYYQQNVVTTRTDVYGFGVVLLELLTGKRVIFKSREDGFSTLSLVDLAVPIILAGCLMKILDPRVKPPNVNEAKALKLLAHIAIECVNFKATIAEIVINLERALINCR